jgi:small-conductance mechanosensitive channel
MPTDSDVFEITRVIQLAIAPVFLLTAIATIINVLISRLARAVDRRRLVEENLPEYVEEARQQAIAELRVLQKRIELVLWAVALAVLGALLVCLLIGTAFAGAFISLDLSRPVAILFIAAMLALTGCLLLFLREISISALTARQTVSPHAARVAFK